MKNASNTTVAEYAYDALGRRIRKIVEPTTTNEVTFYYYTDKWQVATEYPAYLTDDDIPNLVIFDKANLWGSYIDELYYTINREAGMIRNAFIPDHLYSNVAAVDYVTETVAERYEYDAYGQTTIYDANFTERTASAIGNAYLFTGRRLDPESGIYYYRNRYYSPTLGRFLQKDSLGYVDGMNMYEYVGSEPANALDPLGLSPLIYPVSLAATGGQNEKSPAETERKRWEKVNEKVSVGKYMDTWLKYLGAKLDYKNKSKIAMTEECKKKIKCIIRAISWIESRHGNGTGNFPSRDPMQVGNTGDPAWRTIIGKQESTRPFREGKLGRTEWKDIYKVMKKDYGINGNIIPAPSTMPKGHKDKRFNPDNSYFWGIGWYMYQANQVAGDYIKGNKKSAWCFNGCELNDMIKRAAYYNGKPGSGKEGDVDYSQKIKNAVNMIGCGK